MTCPAVVSAARSGSLASGRSGVRPDLAGYGLGRRSFAWNSSAVLITATDSAGNLDYWWQANGTTGWNQQTVA